MIRTDGRPTIAWSRKPDLTDELTTDDLRAFAEYERLRKQGLDPVEAARAAGLV